MAGNMYVGVSYNYPGKKLENFNKRTLIRDQNMNQRFTVLLTCLLTALSMLVMTGCGTSTPEAPTSVPTGTATSIPPTGTSAPPTATLTSIPDTPTPTVAPSAADVSIDGQWEGALEAGGTTIGMLVEFITEQGDFKAFLDIPAQSLYDYSLSEVGFDGTHVHFEGFKEANRLGVWDGELQDDGTISGEFTQLGYSGTFKLTPAQMPPENSEPLSYTEEEVEFQNGEITLSGTLTIPEGDGPHAVFILISGSGAQNRDEEIFGFKIFGIIADHLTRNGIAVLRYDDRGVGGSTGSTAQSTSEDFAADVLAAVELLKGRQDIDPQYIGLLGHSEGGYVAPMAAIQSQDISMVILFAGPAMRGDEVIYTQVERIMQVGGSSKEQIQEALETQRRYFEALLSGEGWEEEKAKIRESIVEQVEALPEEQKEALGDLDEYVNIVYEQQIASLESPWYRFFLQYDPIPALEELTIPVLALFGGLDVQVIADENKLLMEQALERGENEDATLIIYPQANHLFQQAVTGSTAEYSELEKAFISGFLDDTTAWILERIE